MHEPIVTRYLDSFNETDPARRRALIDELYAADGDYTDPHVSVRGREAIAAFLTEMRRQFPSAHFSLAGAVDGHHDQARFSWHLTLDGKPDPVVVGFDVIALGGGQIQRVLGFIDRGPG